MAKVDGDDTELTASDASLIKGMLNRGDKQHHIAAYFDVDFRAVSHVTTGKTFGTADAAPVVDLPPPGPYRSDPTYISFYKNSARE